MVEVSLRGPKFFRAKIRGRKLCIERRVGKMPDSENKTKPISKPGPLIKEIYGFVKERG